MKHTTLSLIVFFAMCLGLNAKEVVVLLHGLARSPQSMTKIERALEKRGYEVLYMGYPSRKFSIEKLSEIIRDEIVKNLEDVERIHFVTHSMGGIIVRYMQQQFPIDNIGKVVMLSPPNQGSEVVDKLGRLKLFKWINGPAGSQLGTTKGSLPLGLDGVDFELGVITGDRSINWILSCMIPGKDDGKVSIESAKVDGMKDFKVVHATHPFIMKNRQVIDDICAFLRSGSFNKNN